MSMRVFNTEPLTRQEAWTALRDNIEGKQRQACAANCGSVLFQKGSTDANPKYGRGGDISRIQGSNIYFHTACMPGQTWQQKVVGGTRATTEGAWTWMRRHPYITLTALAALGAATGYMYASSETFQTTCFRDLSDKTVAWCANVASKENLSNVVYEKFQRVNDWVPSNDLSTKTYENVKEGGQFIYNTFTRYLVNDPFEPIKKSLSGLISQVFG